MTLWNNSFNIEYERIEEWSYWFSPQLNLNSNNPNSRNIPFESNPHHRIKWKFWWNQRKELLPANIFLMGLQPFITLWIRKYEDIKHSISSIPPSSLTLIRKLPKKQKITNRNGCPSYGPKIIRWIALSSRLSMLHSWNILSILSDSNLLLRWLYRE